MEIKVIRILSVAICVIILQIAGSSYLWGINPPADIIEAKEFCDNADLRPIEGLWIYPEDETTVMIYRADTPGKYEIWIVESPDCSLTPGMKIGELQTTPDPDKYSINLFTQIKKGILKAPCSATATYSETKESLTFKKPSFRIRLNPSRLLPYFWRMVSVSFGNKEAAPEGMIKIYPSYDHNGSSRRYPRYL